jgi:glucose-6-phosphate 1-dehydrogenase
VPFYFRTGKSLPVGKRQLTIVFKQPPLALFERADVSTAAAAGNRITFDLGNDAKISASFMSKVPGHDLRLGTARLEFQTTQQFGDDGLLEAYERLIHDALIGDHTLFTRSDGIERLWEVVTPVLDHPEPVQPYAAGSWGLDAVNDLVAPTAGSSRSRGRLRTCGHTVGSSRRGGRRAGRGLPARDACRGRAGRPRRGARLARRW